MAAMQLPDVLPEVSSIARQAGDLIKRHFAAPIPTAAKTSRIDIVTANYGKNGPFRHSNCRAVTSASCIVRPSKRTSAFTSCNTPNGPNGRDVASLMRRNPFTVAYYTECMSWALVTTKLLKSRPG